SGAHIHLNGTSTGRATPDTLVNVPAGQHILKLTTPGFRDTTISLTIYPNNYTFVNVNMLSLTGTIIVTSSPSGAEIFFNDIPAGKTTPDTLGTVQPGNYNIKVKLAGFIDYSQNIGMQEGQIRNLNFDWSALGYGALNCTSNPSGAAIFLNGQNIIAKTPKVVSPVPTGLNTIILKLFAHLDLQADTTLPSGRFFDLHLDLTPVQILVNSTPGGARLYVDGAFYGFTPTLLSGVVAEGMHQMRLEKVGCEIHTENRMLNHADSIEINLTEVFDVLLYDDFNRSVSSISSEWTVNQDQWQVISKGSKEPDQSFAQCLALPTGAPSCGLVTYADSLDLTGLYACTLSVQQYEGSGYLAAYANGGLLPGIFLNPYSATKASLDNYLGQKISLSFYGCPDATL
ncbi:MAG: PEGA domain-containing protein, partial [candidate division Zixibacteria bacterium]|nr:PEGA domain-containing protein [candidate division Zixibacteria bacterium]